MSITKLRLDKIQRKLDDDGKTLRVRIPVEMRKRGGRKSILLPQQKEQEVNMPLVIGIARAHRWVKLLESGEVDSVHDLVKKVGVHHAYIFRFLRLTILAPDIIEAILDGKEPMGLSLAKLQKDNVPLVWGDQRRFFSIRRL